MAPRSYFFRSTTGSLIGPISLNTVAEMIREGKVKANTPVSLDGQDFKPMKALPELATLLSVDVELEDSDDEEFFETPPTYSGDLLQVSMPKLMYHFTAAKANGKLLLTNRTIRKEVFLLNGKPVAANSNQDKDRLSVHLVKNKVVDSATMKKLLGLLHGKEDRLSDLLVQRRIIEPHKLFEHLKNQLLEKIHEVFSWRVGQYAFYDGQEHKGSLLPLNANPWEIIANGVRTGYKLAELRVLLEPLKNRLLLQRDNPHVHVSKLLLHPKELKVFKSVAQGQTLGSILNQLGGRPEDDKMVLSMIYMGIEIELIGIGEELTLDEQQQESQQIGEEWDMMLNDAFDVDSFATNDGGQQMQSSIQTSPTLTRQEQNLLEKLNSLKEQNHFERLGISPGSTISEASKAFMKVARSFHPDQVPQDASENVRKLTSEVFALYNEAHQVLSDEKKAKDYAEAIEAGFEDGKVDVSNILESEALFQKGEVLINNNKFTEAKKVFEQAVELNPDEGEFLIYLGYATFFANTNAGSMVQEQTINMIKRGLSMRDNNVAAGYLFVGRIYKAMGDLEKAQKNFKKVLSLESKNLDAARELRLLNMRTHKKKGLFKRK